VNYETAGASTRPRYCGATILVTVSNPRVALVTSENLPDLDQDNAGLISALADAGVTATAEIWSNPAVNWDEFDLVVIRSTWDYSSRRDEFVQWARSVERLSNSAQIVEWNTDKYYLKRLGEAGIPVVRTVWLDPDRHLSSQAIHTRLPAFGDFVIKPTISSGSQDTARYQEATAPARTRAINQVRDMLASGRHVMIQPYLSKVDEAGEAALVFIEGEFSHAVRKTAMLVRGDEPATSYVPETLQSTDVSDSYVALAKDVIAKAHEVLGDGEEFLYARVDFLPGEDGEPLLLELELTEPALFLSTHEGALEKFAQAIAKRVGA